MRIRWRLTWYGIGFTALTLVGFTILIVLLVEGSAGQDQDQLLSTIADEAAESIAGVDSADVGTGLEMGGVSPLVVDAETSLHLINGAAWSVAAQGLSLNVLVSLDRLGEAHGELRGAPCTLQGWWFSDEDVWFAAYERP